METENMANMLGHGQAITILSSQKELENCREENRSLKIKIAGVETLSSLLNGTRDELETVSAENDSLEMELARLQCRCSMLEKEVASKEADVRTSNTSGKSQQMFEAILKENKKLKKELKQAQKMTSCSEQLFDPETMLELLSFKGEVEMEIQHIQKAMKSQENESQISQISRLLGQVSKLEFQLKSKDEECQSLKTQIEHQNACQLMPNQRNPVDVESPTVHENVCPEPLLSVRTVDTSAQTDCVVQAEYPEIGSENNHNIVNEMSESSQKNSITRPVRRRNSKRASGDWSMLKKTYSSIFHDDWHVDKISSTEQLKVTQDLLVQANEIIMIMSEENDKLLKVNAMLLKELQGHEGHSNSQERKSMVERLKFLFSELSFESGVEDIGNMEEVMCTDGHLEQLQNNQNNANVISGCLTEVNNNGDMNGGLVSSGSVNEIGNQNNPRTRDSGVEIGGLESDKHTLTQTSIDMVAEETTESTRSIKNAKDVCRGEENSRLTSLLVLEAKKLSAAESKVNELQSKLLLFEKKDANAMKRQEVIQGTQYSEKRMCKSVNNIPSSVYLPVTYQRIVLESDI